MKVEAVDLFYLSMPTVTTEADGSQDALLVRVRSGDLEGWGECEAAPLPSIAAFVCPMSHGVCRPVGEAVLGATLDTPEDIARIAARVEYESMDLLQAHAGESNFGFKDPRALLVIDGWKALYPKIEFIGIYRHPNAVAKSLEKRNYRTREEWLELWYAYNSILYKQYKRNPFPLLCFDDDEALLDEKIFRAAGQMGLTRQDADEKFYTSELRHNDSSGEEALPWKIKRLYRKLKSAEF